MYFLTWVWGALTGFLPFLVQTDEHLKIDDIGIQDYCDSEHDVVDDDDVNVKGACLPQHVNLPCVATSQGKLTQGKNN